MRRILFRGSVVLGCALVLSACALFGGDRSGHARRGPPPQQAREAEWHPAIAMLLRYDFNNDGSITRAEMEAGLKADFDAADTNKDGKLDEDEVRAVNRQRLSQDASTASPLVDWNHDGYVDFEEFAATPRSLFDQLDLDNNGVLSPQELNPRAPPSKQPQSGQSSSGGHRRRGGGG